MLLRTHGHPALADAEWSSNAKRALAASPDYFLWWYTTKSIALVLAFGALTYACGHAQGRRSR